CRRTCPSWPSLAAWRPTTCWRSRSATRPDGCSGRSPSTTCSIARCRATGGADVPRHDISTPSKGNRPSIYYDPEAFGNFSEAIARNLGTARFLVIQTVVVALWITIHVVAVGFRWDPYP